MFDVVVAPATTTADAVGGDGDGTASSPQRKLTPQLAFLPTKFRKLVWIKRNDFIIVESGDEVKDDEVAVPTSLEGVGDAPAAAAPKDQSAGLGFRHVVKHILYKDQIKNIKTKGLWPSDPFFADALEGDEDAGGAGEDNDGGSDEDGGGYEDEDGIVFEDPLADEYMVNTNRIATLRIADSSSSEEESDYE